MTSRSWLPVHAVPETTSSTPWLRRVWTLIYQSRVWVTVTFQQMPEPIVIEPHQSKALNSMPTTLRLQRGVVDLGHVHAASEFQTLQSGRLWELKAAELVLQPAPCLIDLSSVPNMPIHWHHTSHPVIASSVQPPVPSGAIRAPFRGPGSYLFYVDHRPHDNRLLTTFAAVPRVVACAPNGRVLAQLPVRHDRFGDRNAIVWDVRNGAGTGFFTVYVPVENSTGLTIVQSISTHTSLDETMPTRNWLHGLRQVCSRNALSRAHLAMGFSCDSGG